MPRFSIVGVSIVAAATLAASTARTASPRFYSDDPIATEPESRDASKAAQFDVGLMYDLSYNLFVTAHRAPLNVHATNVNTIDEVPDSSWFTNRILPRRVSLADAVRGPNAGAPPNPER